MPVKHLTSTRTARGKQTEIEGRCIEKETKHAPCTVRRRWSSPSAPIYPPPPSTTRRPLPPCNNPSSGHLFPVWSRPSPLNQSPPNPLFPPALSQTWQFRKLHRLMRSFRSQQRHKFQFGNKRPKASLFVQLGRPVPLDQLPIGQLMLSQWSL